MVILTIRAAESLATTQFCSLKEPCKGCSH